MSDRRPALLIDIGNCRIKWGLLRHGRIETEESSAITTGEPFDALLRFLGENAAPGTVWVSNVAGSDIAFGLQTWTERRWGLTPRFVAPRAHGYGIANGYVKPEKLGVDRWVALIGARRAGYRELCVADCGTAITFDALDGDGNHLGGLIAPGISLMRKSLASGTSDLPLAHASDLDDLGRDTVNAIAGGTRKAAAGLIEHAFRETSRRLGVRPRLLLTGGDASAITAVLEIPHEVRPALVLEGLRAIAESET